MRRVECNFEFLFFLTSDGYNFWTNFESRITGLWRFNSCETEFEGELFLIEATVLNNF